MKKDVEAATTPASPPALVERTVPDLLVRHCLSLDDLARPRRPAKVRLEDVLGAELTRRLLASLTKSGRR